MTKNPDKVKDFHEDHENVVDKCYLARVHGMFPSPATADEEEEQKLDIID